MAAIPANDMGVLNVTNADGTEAGANLSIDSKAVSKPFSVPFTVPYLL